MILKLRHPESIKSQSISNKHQNDKPFMRYKRFYYDHSYNVKIHSWNLISLLLILTHISNSATILKSCVNTIGSSFTVSAFIPLSHTSSIPMYPHKQTHPIMQGTKQTTRIPKTFLYLSTTGSSNTHEHTDTDTDTDTDIHTHAHRHHSYFATCIPGLSTTLAYEISTILPHLPQENIQIQGSSGVSFITNSRQDGLKTLYWLRTAHRLLELICTNDPTMQQQHQSLDTDMDLDIDMDMDEYTYTNPILDRHDLYEYIRHSCNVQDILGDGRGGILTISCKCLSSSSSSTFNLPEDLRHLHYTALTVKNALVDECRDLHPDNLRPDVNTDDPDVPFFLAIKGSNTNTNTNTNTNKNKNKNYNTRRSDPNTNDMYSRHTDHSTTTGAIVSLYRSLNSFKSSLHKRGYRSNDAIHKAAMKESLACGLLYASGFDKLIQSTQRKEGKAVLLDPMMGSATFLLEASYLASDVAPGLLREKFAINSHTDHNNHHDNDYNHDDDTSLPMRSILIPPVLRWKGTDLRAWKTIRSEAKERAMLGRQWLLSSCRKGDVVLRGNEMDMNAFQLAKRCLTRGGLSLDDMVTITNLDCHDWYDVQSIIEDGRSIIVTNPPWGLRLHDTKNQRDNRKLRNQNKNKDEMDYSYIESSWTSLGIFLKRECSGAEAWILSGNKNLTKLLKMKKTRGIPIHTGEEDLRWVQYHIFDWKRDGSFGDKGTSAQEENAKLNNARL